MTFNVNKTKYSKVSELAKLYAEGQRFGSAREGRVFIEDDTIYSYGKHFPLARKIDDNTYEFNTAKYSQTTSKQQAEVRRALQSKGYKIIDKPL